MSETEPGRARPTSEPISKPISKIVGPPAPDEKSPPPVRFAIRPGDAVGRYLIRDLLGTGGMGQVFAALDMGLGRVVALKVIRPTRRIPSSRDRSRLFREAQALAKVQHPNVVAIHDVGAEDDQVFIAMDFVAGPTLTAWLASSPRSWREIRDKFVAAGRGLAAAHQAGIVHRDFKPSNVIVGSDRVVVVDFGLARGPDEQAGKSIGPCGPDSILDVNLTLTGERVGTPRYMAPEQHLDEDPVTAKADQFAFATALWAALYHTQPFTGQTTAELLHSIARGPAPPPKHGVPARIHEALVRALALQPNRRWPTLAELLDEIARDPAARRRRALGVVAAAVAALAVPSAFVAGRSALAPSCAAPTTGLWGESKRAEVRTAFLTTGIGSAGESFDRVDNALRARLGALGRAHEEACAATEIRHEQSATLMDARMACLARARDQIAAFIDVLHTPDGRVLERAASEASTLGDVEGCADAAALTAVLPPPRDARSAAAVAALERELTRVAALDRVGRWQEARDQGWVLVEKARALGHPPLTARVLFEVGHAACAMGNARQAADALYEAATAAGAGRDDVAAARIYSMLAYCVGNVDARLDTGRAIASLAEAAVARAGAPASLRAQLFFVEQKLRFRSGDVINALAYSELALMAYRTLYGEDHPEYARALSLVAASLDYFGAFRAARAAHAQALPVLERTIGPSHPITLNLLSQLSITNMELGDLAAAEAGFEHVLALSPPNEPAGRQFTRRNLARIRDRRGQLDAALELARRAAATDEATLRSEHPDIGFDMGLLCRIAIDRNDLAEARDRCDKAVAVFTSTFGADSAEVGDIHVLLAEIARKRHDLGEARRHIDAGLAAHRRSLGPHHPLIADDELVLGEILLEGDAAAARSVLEHALAVEEAARDSNAAEVVTARTLLAEALIAVGDRDGAIAFAERAVDAASGAGLRADFEGRARFALALALAASDRTRALELAREARTRLRGSPAEDEIGRIDRWVASR